MAARALTVEDLLTHQSWLHRLAVHIVRDDELAHDLVQETWLAALDGAPPSRDKVRPWLAGVLRNLARMSVRTAVRRRGREAACVDGEDALPSPEELLARVEAQKLLADEVQRLDEPYRSTILLLYFEGLSATDIARRLGVPDGTIRWRHHQALENLRKVLAEKDPQHRRLRALLVPAGYATAVAVEGGLLGSKSLWASLVLVLASLLSLWPNEAPLQPGRRDVAPLAAGVPAAALPAIVVAATLPGVRVVPAETGVELLVQVTDLDDVPIAGARAWIGSLAVGSTAVNGQLVIAEEVRTRIPHTGSITVHAPEYQAVTAAYRGAQPLHIRLVPLAGTEMDTSSDPAHRQEVDSLEMPLAALPVSAASVGWPPNRIRCSTAELLTNNLNRMNKELSMRLMSPRLYAMILAMVGAVNQGGCLMDGAASDSGKTLNDDSPGELDRNDENDGDSGGDTCIPADPCDGASGTGSYVGVRCDGEIPFDMDPDLACAAARERCQREAGGNPEQSIYCEWNGTEIFRHEASAGSCNVFGPAPSDGCESPPPPTCDHPCASAAGDGLYQGFFCGEEDHLFIQTGSIDCQAALGNCALNAALNPDQSIYCQWNGVELFRREVDAGACSDSHGPPALSCTMPVPDGCDGHHPCALHGGTGSYGGSFCGGHEFIRTNEIDCQAALGNCMLNAALNPGESIRCEWEGAEIYRREVEAGACDSFGQSCTEPPGCSDPCAGATGTGSYSALGCEDGEVRHGEDGITCQSARELCTQLAGADPSQNLLCVWNDREILRHEATPGTCNAFGPAPCAR